MGQVNSECKVFNLKNKQTNIQTKKQTKKQTNEQTNFQVVRDFTYNICL